MFGSYPWNTLPVALEKGAIELINADEMEVGEIYIIVRQGIFGAGIRRDKKITTEVLKYQLSSILKQDDSKYDIKKIIDNRLWRYNNNFEEGSGFDAPTQSQTLTAEYEKIMKKYGLVYNPSIDLSDTFIMACYDMKKDEGVNLIGCLYNNLRMFLWTVFSNKDMAFIQKIQQRDWEKRAYVRNKSEIEKNRLMYNVKTHSYNSSTKEISEWAFVFKIQLQNLNYALMNWDAVPF